MPPRPSASRGRRRTNVCARAPCRRSDSEDGSSSRFGPSTQCSNAPPYLQTSDRSQTSQTETDRDSAAELGSTTTPQDRTGRTSGRACAVRLVITKPPRQRKQPSVEVTAKSRSRTSPARVSDRRLSGRAERSRHSWTPLLPPWRGTHRLPLRSRRGPPTHPERTTLLLLVLSQHITDDVGSRTIRLLNEVGVHV